MVKREYETAAQKKKNCITVHPVFMLLIAFFFSLFFLQMASAAEEQGPFITEWGGHLKGIGRVSWQDDDTPLRSVENNPFYDGALELRLKNRTSWSDNVRFDTHYQMVLAGGDSRYAASRLEDISPYRAGQRYPAPSDSGRLFDLTATLSEEDDRVLSHRLDRLALTVERSWGRVRFGRQALSWGNGLLFNVMDLFNPFSPTDISREYKTGDDMALLQVSSAAVEDVQILLVPGRNPDSRNLGSDYSSLAGKVHLTREDFEIDFLVARHLEDNLLGVGASGYWGTAAWRCDATWTDLSGDGLTGDAVALVANMDYSWVWLDKNWYGFGEFYYNSLGEDDYGAALLNPDLTDRIARGELFTLGRRYLSASLQCELHPLLHVYLTAINNMDDPSGVIQPYLTWSVEQNVQLTLGGSFYYGESGSEYGGFFDPSRGYFIDPPAEFYVWLTSYF